MDLTNEDVADILAAVDSLPYDEVDLRTARFRLTLRRSPGGGWTEESQVLAEPDLLAPTPATSATPTASPSAGARSPDISEMSGGPEPGADETAGAPDADAGENAAGDGAAGSDGLVPVVAPLPGTFYRAPRPGAAPFVEAGDPVGPDTVVAIVATMKLMNSVPAGTSGRVARICLDNAEFAAQGSTLMLIDPDS